MAHKKIEKLHPGIKNNKYKLAQEIEAAYWWSVETNDVVKLFEFVEYNSKGLNFELTLEAKDILDIARIHEILMYRNVG